MVLSHRQSGRLAHKPIERGWAFAMPHQKGEHGFGGAEPLERARESEKARESERERERERERAKEKEREQERVRERERESHCNVSLCSCFIGSFSSSGDALCHLLCTTRHCHHPAHESDRSRTRTQTETEGLLQSLARSGTCSGVRPHTHRHTHLPLPEAFTCDR